MEQKVKEDMQKLYGIESISIKPHTIINRLARWLTLLAGPLRMFAASIVRGWLLDTVIYLALFSFLLAWILPRTGKGFIKLLLESEKPCDLDPFAEEDS